MLLITLREVTSNIISYYICSLQAITNSSLLNTGSQPLVTSDTNFSGLNLASKTNFTLVSRPQIHSPY